MIEGPKGQRVFAGKKDKTEQVMTSPQMPSIPIGLVSSVFSQFF